MKRVGYDFSGGPGDDISVDYTGGQYERLQAIRNLPPELRGRAKLASRTINFNVPGYLYRLIKDAKEASGKPTMSAFIRDILEAHICGDVEQPKQATYDMTIETYREGDDNASDSSM